MVEGAAYRETVERTAGRARSWRRAAVGVDGCPAGWVAVRAGGDGRWEAVVYGDLASLLRDCVGVGRVCIDMPIGLVGDGPDPRPCDVAARKVLGPRRTSVFAPPCRAALRAGSYREACAINRERTGKAITKQTWNIAAKMREVDDLLNGAAAVERVAGERAVRGRAASGRSFGAKRARGIVCESHPEVCWWALNGGAAMASSKRKAAGRTERTAVLRRYVANVDELLAGWRGRFRRRDVHDDDLLDAMVLALTAGGMPGRLRSLPAKPTRDGRGLPMRIVYREPDAGEGAGRL